MCGTLTPKDQEGLEPPWRRRMSFGVRKQSVGRIAPQNCRGSLKNNRMANLSNTAEESSEVGEKIIKRTCPVT